MIDTHAHLFDDIFDSDIDFVLENAFSAGVSAILMPAIEPESFNKMLNLAQKDDRLFCSIGIHPHNSNELNVQALKLIEEISVNPKIKAIGEIGLDYYYDFAPKEVQKEAFIKQIELAKKFNLPIIVHNRESDEDLLNILEKMQDGTLNGVLHCFSGNLDMMKKSIDLGFYISFTGNITFKKADELRQVVTKTPLDRILLETDSPWMAPVPNRGKRNEPKYLKIIAEKIAELKSTTIEKVNEMTTKSAKELFKLMLVLICVFNVLFPNYVFSQIENNNNENVPLTDSTQNTGFAFDKYFGVAPILGTNTVVNTFYPGGQDVSLDGLLTYGLGLFSNPIEWCFVNVTYLHFVNKKPNIETKGVLDPEKSNLYEFTAGVIMNPNGKVNFYGVLGYSMTNTTYSMYNWTLKQKSILNDSKDGIIAGVGFFANFPFEKVGTFVLNAEWRLNFIIDRTKLNYDPRKAIDDPLYLSKTEYTTFFSIPRVSIIWYPPLDEWFGLRK